MRRRFAIAALLIGASASTPALALNDDDFASIMGMLWRLREPVCPSMTFDPDIFVKGMKLPGGTAEAFRRAHRAAFERGYADAGELLGRGTAGYCQQMETWSDGKHDFWGNVKDVPSPAPLPGVTIRH